VNVAECGAFRTVSRIARTGRTPGAAAIRSPRLREIRRVVADSVPARAESRIPGFADQSCIGSRGGFILRRRKRVTCAKCGASHPSPYKGQPCLICGSTINAAHEHRNKVDTVASENRKTEDMKEQQYKAQIAALQSERDELNAALAALRHRDVVSISSYHQYVKVAAKGMAERDNHPLPESVTTPDAFYEVMAESALDAVGFSALVERLARAMREPGITQESLRRAGARSKHARASGS
jgi:hypothetical protein